MMGDHTVTQDELRRLLAEQSHMLVKAMVDTNQPLERQLNKVEAHLKDLNGKVATHEVQLGRGGERMDGFKEDIARIDRRIYDRRKEDKDDSNDTGEKRRLTRWDVYVAIISILATVAVLKFFGRMP
jgi:anti-sigma-K factor RskA